MIFSCQNAANGDVGCITFSGWQSYTWKNELQEQKNRISVLLEEMFTETISDHDPMHMIERAIGLAAICMRRLIECRLLTDKFVVTPVNVHEIDLKVGTVWREPFLCHTGSHIFNNYDMTVRTPRGRSPRTVADKFLHARVISVLRQSTYLPDGILIASDTQRLQGIFHFTKDELSNLFNIFLTNEVEIVSDFFEKDPKTGEWTGKVTAVRK